VTHVPTRHHSTSPSEFIRVKQQKTANISSSLIFNPLLTHLLFATSRVSRSAQARPSGSSAANPQPPGGGAVVVHVPEAGLYKLAPANTWASCRSTPLPLPQPLRQQRLRSLSFPLSLSATFISSSKWPNSKNQPDTRVAPPTNFQFSILFLVCSAHHALRINPLIHESINPLIH